MDKRFEWFWMLKTSGWRLEGEEKKGLTERRRGAKRALIVRTNTLGRTASEALGGLCLGQPQFANDTGVPIAGKIAHHLQSVRLVESLQIVGRPVSVVCKSTMIGKEMPIAVSLGTPAEVQRSTVIPRHQRGKLAG
jgi:hypothetical protein